MEKRVPVIKKIGKIFELGYVPSRGDETYSFKTKNSILTGNILNCFAHACFNLTNEQIDELNLYEDEIFDLQGYNRSNLSQMKKEDVAQHFAGLIKDAGLIVEPCLEETVLNGNQWKIALYFDEIEFGGSKSLRDFHFLIQEEDGSWSGKAGYTPRVKKFDKLTEKLDYYYSFYECYAITNPFAEEGKAKWKQKEH